VEDDRERGARHRIADKVARAADAALEQIFDAPTAHPSPEALAGQHLRLLRQGRGWSQQDVAEKMAAYGYKWHQTTVAKLEAAARPLRVNEAVDLAVLFGIPASRLVEPAPAPGDGTLESIVDELKILEARQQELTHEGMYHDAEAAHLNERRAEIAAQLSDIRARIQFLSFWLPGPEKRG
jgi:transcriptional regulator with XRE-family HTH domain